ncbi:conjugal transfer transcriptional regulator TraJ [Legionella fairfieldensis]|uniref:conjugal transfer transcriptional regulator TraJ n=1 Tax=Legionella fairfieldensis TaxID=45064 RepID=UPI0004915556|nr:conjugal transfer transcriptional regulator TraJ [Legionella fairfieldensis]
MDEQEKKQSRKHCRRIRVPVLPDEEQQIKDNAEKVGLPVAVYLRRLALGFEIKSVIDQKQVLELVKINGDLGRLGGLLKLWLSRDERVSGIEPDTLKLILERIKTTQETMLHVVQQLD